jgi:hypothetical protein
MFCVGLEACVGDNAIPWTGCGVAFGRRVQTSKSSCAKSLVRGSSDPQAGDPLGPHVMGVQLPVCYLVQEEDEEEALHLSLCR